MKNGIFFFCIFLIYMQKDETRNLALKTDISHSICQEHELPSKYWIMESFLPAKTTINFQSSLPIILLLFRKEIWNWFMSNMSET